MVTVFVTSVLGSRNDRFTERLSHKLWQRGGRGVRKVEHGPTVGEFHQEQEDSGNRAEGNPP